MIFYVLDLLFKGFNSNESFGRQHQIWRLCNRPDLFCSLGCLQYLVLYLNPITGAYAFMMASLPAFPAPSTPQLVAFSLQTAIVASNH